MQVHLRILTKADAGGEVKVKPAGCADDNNFPAQLPGASRLPSLASCYDTTSRPRRTRQQERMSLFVSTSRALLPCTCRRSLPARALSTSARARTSDPVPPRSFWRTAAQVSPPAPVPVPKPPPSLVPILSTPHAEQFAEREHRGLMGWFRGKGKRGKDDEVEQKARWRVETERTLERTLRGGSGRTHSDGSTAGLNMRCTTLNRKGGPLGFRAKAPGADDRAKARSHQPRARLARASSARGTASNLETSASSTRQCRPSYPRSSSAALRSS